MRLDHVLKNAEHSLVLADGGLGMNGGDPLGNQRLPHLLQQPRELFQPVGHMGQTLGSRSEFAGHQSINRPARQFGVEQRVPGPFLQRLESPQVRLQTLSEDLIVHLQGA